MTLLPTILLSLGAVQIGRYNIVIFSDYIFKKEEYFWLISKTDDNFLKLFNHFLYIEDMFWISRPLCLLDKVCMFVEKGGQYCNCSSALDDSSTYKNSIYKTLKILFCEFCFRFFSFTVNVYYYCSGNIYNGIEMGPSLEKNWTKNNFSFVVVCDGIFREHPVEIKQVFEFSSCPRPLTV